MASLLDNAQVQLEQLENLVEGRTNLANEVQLEDSQLVSDTRSLDRELEEWQAERQLLKTHISNLEQEVVRLVEEDLLHKRELVGLKEQFKCVIDVKDNYVEELKTDLEQYKQLLTQIEGKETHLLWDVHDCREELQKLNLGKTERVPNLCQDLDSLLRNVGEEREKVAREHGLCLENRNLVSDLCGQLDGLLQRAREEKLKVAVDLSTSKHQIRESMEDKSTLGLDKDRQRETVLSSENGDTCIDIETLKQMLQGCLEEKSRLEKDVTRLSLSLEESQSQLDVLTARHSTKNPQLLTKLQGCEDSQNFDQDDDNYDMAPPIHSIDDKYVTNYVREVEAKAYGKALDDTLDQSPDSPAWFKKENCRTTMMDSYLQVHSMELLQQEKDAAVYAEEVARAKLESLLLHLGKSEKGSNDLAIEVEELKDECSVLKRENSILIDKLVKVSEGSFLAAARISTLMSELKERILKFEEESDFRVQIAREKRERDSSLVAAQECDFMHCDIAQKAQEELGRVRSDLTKLLQEYKTLTCQADYDSKQLKVLSVEKPDLLAHVCHLEGETCSGVDKNEIVSSLSVEVSPDFEAPKLVTETRSLEPGTPHQRRRHVVMEKNVEALADRLEGSMPDVFCDTSLGSTLTVTCSCDILDSLHRILLQEISSTRRHLEQVQTELMDHKQHFANIQGKLESSVLLLFPETLVSRSIGIERLYELSDFLINALLRECSKTSEKLQPQQLAEVEILMQKGALIEKDKTNNVGPIGSEKDMGNCNMATLISPSDDPNLVDDLSNMNEYVLQSPVKEAMDIEDLIPEENEGDLSTLVSTMDHTIDVDKAPQVESSGEVGEESESNLVLQRAMQTIKSLESELEFKRRVSCNLQEYLLERNNYIRLLEATFDKYKWPDDYPVSAPLVDKIEWFGKILAYTDDIVEKLEEQMEVPGVNCKSHNSSKESLVAKLAVFGKEVEKEEPERDAVLGEALQKITLLESELEFKKSVSANLQEYLLERNSYIQLLESTVGKYNWPDDYPVSAPLVDKIEYFGKVLACTEDAVKKTKEQLEIPGVMCESHKSSKEVLVAKLAGFGKEVVKEEPGRDAVLGEALQKIESLESELEFKKSVSANLQEYLLERNSYIQLLEATVGKYNWPDDYPVSAPLVDKIEYFGKILACSKDADGNPKKQMGVPGGNCEPDISSKEVLVAKLAAFGKEVEPDQGGVLKQALQKIDFLESELEFKKSVSANLQEYLLERNSYIQLLEATVGKYNWPDDYPVSAPLVEKIKYFGKVLTSTQDAVENPKESIEVLGGNCESDKSSKELLVAKLAAFGKVEKEEPGRDAVLGEALQKIKSLENELEFKKRVAANLQEYLLERNSYIQQLECAVGKYNWPDDYPVSAPLVEKIEWFGKALACTEDAIGDPKESMEVPGGNCQADISSKEVLVAKLAAFGKEVETVEPGRDVVLGEALQRIELLEDELEFKKRVSANLQEYLLERNSYIQLLEATFGKYNWPDDYPVSAPLVQKIEWLSTVVASTENAAGNSEEQMEVPGGTCETDKSSKELLVAKLAAFGKEVEKVEPGSDAVLGEALQKIELLENELEFKKRVSANLQEYLLERNSYIQLLEATFGKYNWPDDYPVSAPLVQKIEWLSTVVASTENAAGNSEEQMEVPGGTCETDKSSKELLVAKLAAFGKEVEKVEPGSDAVLGEALQKIELLENELEFKKRVSANLQEYLLERNSYIQLLEATFGKYNWPDDYPVSAPLVQKIEWLSTVVASTENAAGNSEEQMEVPGGTCETDKSSKELLVANLAAFGKEVEKVEPGSDAVLGEALQKIELLENELEFKKRVSANLQEYLLERNSYIQLLEATFGKYNWPDDYPVSAPLVQKIEWLSTVVASTENAAGNSEEQMEVPGGTCETDKSSKELLVAKLAAFGKEVEKVEPGSDAVLGEALQKIELLENELEFKKRVSANLQEYLLERNSYIQLLEATFGKYNWPDDYPVSAPLVQKIEWLSKVVASKENAAGNSEEQMEVPGGTCETDKSSKELLVAKLAAFGKEVEKEEPERDAVLVPEKTWEGLQYPHSISSPCDSETKSKKRPFLSVSKESMQEVEATFRKFSWPNGYPANAPVCGKIEWLARFFVPLKSAVARDPLNYDPTLSDGMSETTTPVCKKMAVRHATMFERCPEELDSNATLEQVQERLTTLQDQRSSLQGEMDTSKTCSCSRGTSEDKSFIQPVKGTLEKCVWANDHTSPASSPDQVEWLAEAFSAMKPAVVRKSMGAETVEFFLTKLSYVTGLHEALAGDRSVMASPTDSKYSESGSALIGSPICIGSMRDMTSISKNEEDTTQYELTSLQESLEVMEYKVLLESTFQKFSWPNDYPSTDSLVNRIEWLGQTFGVREAGSNDSQISDSAELETVGQLGFYVAGQDAVVVGNCKEAETILKSVSAEVDCADVVHEQLVVLEKRIRALEGELDFKRDVSSGLLQSLMERNSYIQAIEVAVGKFDWPEGYPSGGSLMDKIEWLGSTFTAFDGVRDMEQESFLACGSSGDPESSMDQFLALKETLVAKQVTFTRQASREKYEKDAALRQTRDTISNLENTISVLENDLEYNRGVSSGLQESLVESNGYIQMVEGVLGKFNWPGDYPLTESLSNRIQWLGETFGSVKQGVSDEANDKIEKCNGENDFYTPSKEVLAAKLVALTTQFSEQKSERDVALLEAHKRIVAMEKSIVSLESELEVKKGVSSALQQSLLEENRYIQMVEGTLDKCCWPDDYPSTAPLNDKIEWLVEHLASANEELGTYKQLSGEINSRLLELSEETVFLNTELSCVNREKEALAVKYAVLADQVIEEISGRDAALQEANEKVDAMQCSINALEGKYEQERKSLCDLQRCFQEIFVQLDLVDNAGSKLVYLEEFPSVASLNDRMMWLANTFLSTQQEVDRLRTSSDLMSTALEELHTKAESYHVEKEVLDMKLRELLGNEQLVSTLQKTLSSRELELAELSKKVKEVSADMSAQEIENQSLLQEGRRIHAELEDAKRDKDALKMEVSQMDQKLSSAREKLGAAVSEGKHIEKQRDSLKQMLEENVTELESSNVGHIQALQVKDAELLDIKLKLEQSEEQRELFVSALQEALVQSSFPADLNVMEPLDIIDWLVGEYVHGKETICLWMKRAEDSEKQIVVDRVKYESDFEDTIKELSDIKLKLDQSEKQREIFVSALQEALVQSSLADLNSMEPIDIIHWLVREYVHGKETICLWIKQAEDSEKQVVAGRIQFESDLEDTIKELQDIKLKLEQSEGQFELFVSALQAALVESSLPADLHSMEPLDIIDWLVREHVHGKETISLWMRWAEDSEKQVVAERVKYESDLEDTLKELQDIKLKLEQSEKQCKLFVSALQEVLVESSLPADLHSMEPLDIIDWLVHEHVHGKETISLWMKRAEDSEKQVVAERVKYESHLEDTIQEAMSHSSKFSIRIEELEDIIQHKDNSLRTMEIAQGQAAAKCSDLVEQLKESRRQCDVLAAEVDKLPETLRNKDNDIIRLQDEAALMAGSSVAHVQSLREVSLDVGEESDDFFIDPRHGFKTLVNSRNIPNATRCVANQFDLLCFGAGRLFMRQPMARLALAAYWIFIHVWMAYFSLSATKYTKITHL